MLFYIILLVSDLFLWYILTRELRHRKRILKGIVLLIKAVVSVVFIVLFLSIVLHRGEFADQENAFRQIQMGTMALLLVTASAASVFLIIIGRLLACITGRDSKWTGMAVVVLFLFTVLMVTDSYFRQRLDIRYVREEVKVPGLDPALDGLKIALLSDLHLSSWYGSFEKLDRAMQVITGEKPDLLLNAGDFITYGWQEFGECDTILRKAVATAGAFAVEGNHDDGTYHPDYNEQYGVTCREMVKRKTESSGYTVIRDSSLIISHRGTSIAIAGVEAHGHHLDMSYGNFEKALAPLPDTIFTILLLHDPEGWLLSSVAGRMPQLTVSGHTHGFQVGLPGALWSPSSLIHRWWKGLYEFRGSRLYVTTGLGTIGMAARIFMPPEIIFLTVTSD
jgi:predicted MPP superfamily phosphohydrolase